MEAICRDAGLSKEGMGICFSLPVDGVAGIRSISNLDDRKEKEKSDTPKGVDDVSHAMQACPNDRINTSYNCGQAWIALFNKG